MEYQLAIREYPTLDYGDTGEAVLHMKQLALFSMICLSQTVHSTKSGSTMVSMATMVIWPLWRYGHSCHRRHS